MHCGLRSKNDLNTHMEQQWSESKTNQGEWQGCTHAKRTFSSPINWCSLQRYDKQGYTVCSSIQHTFPMYCCVPIALLNALDANSIKVNIILCFENL